MTTTVGHHIVVGVDGSDAALNATRWAAEEARERRVPLVLAHAYLPLFVTYPGVVTTPESVDAIIQSQRDDVAQYLNRATEVATEVAPNVDIRPETRMEGPVPALIALSRQAQLVVLGSRGRGGFSSLLVGSAATALAAHGHSPIAVIRGRTPTEPPPETGPIVVGVDGSPTSERAIALAFDEAAFRGADLLAVHTWIDAAFESDFELTRNMVDWQAVEAAEELVLAERLAGWQERYPDVRVQRMVVRDRPGPGLLSQAERARMIIVGSRGRGGFTGMLLGSTSRTLLHHASCPVIIARPEDQS
ncbi:universal stress protein [Actinoalloteichus sp. AHMU CJ021]|uniref:universal stress protein n=1 Tax=Actinoalloteichus TaxID=65496 RepID=UPI000CA06E5C|nr:universal stress protein [Actinoalloteichus sp. AHMU CJ021]